MTRPIFEGEHFNKEIKEQFLEQYSEATKVTFGRVFKRSSIVEEQLGKDLFDFDRDEIKQVLFLLNPVKLSTSQNNGHVIRGYISWAISEGYRGNTINPLDGIEGDWYRQFLDKSKKTVFPKEEIDSLIDECVNDQDKAIILALFDGIKSEELLVLKPKDIDEEAGVINLIDEKHNRREYYPRDTRVIPYLLRAARQERYIKNNGNASDIARSLETNLIDSGFVIKISNTFNKDSTPDRGVFYRKFRMLQKFIKGLNYLNPANLRNSGMLHMAYELYKRDGELATKQLDEICEHYGIRKFTTTVTSGGGLYHYEREVYDRYKLTKDFLNVETINELYMNDSE